MKTSYTQAEEAFITATPTLAKLHALALADLRQVAATPGYEVYMGNWHIGRTPLGADNPACLVCLAGAVMAKSLGASPYETTMPADFIVRGGAGISTDEGVRLRLLALDSLRCGLVGEAAGYLDIELPDGVPAQVIRVEWEAGAERWWKDAERFQAKLEEWQV